jgi:hypothetical protein
LLGKRLSEEVGYSLVEVMASIIILSLAILPMVGMFDMGIRTATTGSNYDKARTLANLKLEEAKSLSFGNVRDNFPVNGSTPDTTTGYYDSGFIAQTGPTAADFANFEYRVEKQYMVHPPTSPASTSWDFDECDSSNGCNPPTSLIRITVTVQFPNGSTYTTLGLVAG